MNSLGSNSGSPTRAGPSTPRAGSPSGPVDASEIVQALLTFPEGVAVGQLLRHFGARVGDGPGQMPRKEWIKLVKDKAVFGSDKLLRLKPDA